jgi:hypothetical protein
VWCTNICYSCNIYLTSPFDRRQRVGLELGRQHGFADIPVMLGFAHELARVLGTVT